MSFEYLVLAGSAAIFLLVLLGVGLVLLVKAFGGKGGGGGISLPNLPSGRKPARAFFDAMTELMHESAAEEIQKAFTDPANNPHIPSFLAPARAPEAGPEAPKAP